MVDDPVMGSVGEVIMDAKGRPTKLEDIISAESLMDNMHRTKNTTREQLRDATLYSTGLIDSLRGFKADPRILLAMMVDPNTTIALVMMSLITCIDEAIKQRAEVDELREMADK